jgi:lysozyme
MAIELDKEGMEMTKRFEGGFKPNMYQIKFKKKDKTVVDVPTIGYGFNMAANNLTNPVMTLAEADALFPKIYQRAVDNAMQFAGPTWATLSPVQRNILTDMAYNLGGEGLAGFVNMQKNLLSGNMAGVPVEMIDSDWYRQVGNRSKTLVDMWNQSLIPTPLAPTLAAPEAPRKMKTGRVTPNDTMR